VGANRSGTIRKQREKRRKKHLKRLADKAEKKSPAGASAAAK
jgi:hypothetical protein